MSFLNELWQGDCLKLMGDIPSGSVDMVLCDLPYGYLECAWDTAIDLPSLWSEYRRVVKPSGAIVLTALQPFTSRLVLSNPDMFKYAWVWKKTRVGNFATAPLRPLGEHEDILVFGFGGMASNAKIKMTYNPQGTIAVNKTCKGKGAWAMRPGRTQAADYIQATSNYPRTILEVQSEGKPVHPTQKPVALFEYLIRTYTNPGEVVLDNCCGSGTTGVACMKTGRQCIQIELDPGYCDIAYARLMKAYEDAA